MKSNNLGNAEVKLTSSCFFSDGMMSLWLRISFVYKQSVGAENGQLEMVEISWRSVGVETAQFVLECKTQETGVCRV